MSGSSEVEKTLEALEADEARFRHRRLMRMGWYRVAAASCLTLFGYLNDYGPAVWALGLGYTLLTTLLLFVRHGSRPMAWHIAAWGVLDSLFVTLAVWALGATTNSMLFFYGLVVVAYALRRERWVGLTVLATCLLSFAAVVGGEQLGWLPMAPGLSGEYLAWYARRQVGFLYFLAVVLSLAASHMLVRQALDRTQLRATLFRRLYEAEHETRQLQRQLERVQHLESVGVLASGVAHDFNNLLVPILTHAEVARDLLDEESPVQEDLRGILSAAARARRLVEQLLATARKRPLDPHRIDLHQVVEAFAPLLDQAVRGVGEVGIALAPGPAVVRMDPRQLEQILLNLVVNAREARGNAPAAIRLSTERVQLVGHPGLDDGPYLELRVVDEGSGMDEETRRRAMEPFFTTKDEEHGTGLGLAVVSGLASQAEGDLEVFSEPGVGTEVRLLLPLSEGLADRPVTGEIPVPALGEVEGRILVVDDEEQVARAMARVLERQGYEVVCAGSGDEALRLVADRAQAFDLLVTDVVMPGMTGDELARRFSVLHPETAVLYVSGNLERYRGDEELLRAAPVVAKPFGHRELLEAVSGLLHRGGDKGAQPLRSARS